MTEKQGNQVEGTLKDLQKSMKMKQYLVQTLENEYKNVCKKTESNLKELEELTANIYNLEGYINASECRLTEYRKKETEWQKDNLSLQESVDTIKKSLEEAGKLANADDIKFDQDTVKLVEERRKDRNSFDSNTSKESLHKLEMTERELVQETIDVKNMLKEEKNKHPFTVPEEVSFILKNTDLSGLIEDDMNELFERKKKSLKKLDDMKDKVRLLEDEIDGLSKRF